MVNENVNTQKRTILVTGSSKGIGRAIAIRLAGDGFEVVVHCNQDVAGAVSTLDEIQRAGGCGRILQFDVADRDACMVSIEADIEANRPYYGVILNAGIVRDGAFPALSGDDWDDVLRTNLDGFYNVLQPCIATMIAARKGGRIVSLSSVSGLTGNRGQVNYSAAKAGIIGATKALAVELARRAITVNCVAPGLIETGMVELEPDVLNEVMRTIPMRRMGTTDEVAAAVSFLVSDAASYITRQVISVNGGIL